MIGSIQSGVALRLPPHSKSAARAAGSFVWSGLVPGVLLRFTPGRGPQPSISAGVEVFMPSPAPRVFKGYEATTVVTRAYGPEGVGGGGLPGDTGGCGRARLAARSM
jgi:hypothetical protein